MAVVPVKSRQITEVLEALKQCINRMGGKPQTIYSDSEGAFVSGEFQKYFKENNIRHLMTSTHAGVAERAIRTIKNMIYLRVEKNKTAWYDNIYPVVLTYNNKMVSRVTGMTSAQASKPHNHIAVRWNLEKNRRTGRRYPDVNVGDNVKIYKQKDKLDKQQTSLWSNDNYEVVNIVDSLGQPLYELEGREKLLMRHEILKVNIPILPSILSSILASMLPSFCPLYPALDFALYSALDSADGSANSTLHAAWTGRGGGSVTYALNFTNALFKNTSHAAWTSRQAWH